jgi:S1-C subfamily serine protease
MLVRDFLMGLLPVVLALCPTAPHSALAQFEGAPAGQPVELELRGSVERVFTSDDRADGARLVEIVLESVALADARAPVQQVRIPAPGDVVFVLVDDSAAGQSLRRVKAGPLPLVGDVVRATVRDAGRGVWSAAGVDWYESVDSRRRPLDRDAPRTGDAASTPQVKLRGMTCEATIEQGRVALEVVSVAAEGPAHDAGFQVGDVIVAANGASIPSIARIRQIVQQAEPLKLSVVDVNTGRLAVVTLADSTTGGARRSGPEDDSHPSPAARIASALGIEVESARVGLRDAVKVTFVDPTKRGAEGGLEVGDVIVGVGKQQIASVAEFAKALPLRGGDLTLLVRDVRSGREVPIQVQAENSRPATDDDAPPSKNPAAEPGAADRLGLSTELTFYSAEAAVKVVAVQRNSPASRAGVRPGWIIVRANDVPVLHPDDLAKAEDAARGRIALRIVDPADGRQATVNIDL